MKLQRTKGTTKCIIIIILQQIDSNIINPKIIGNSLEISPLLVIFAVTLGGAYFGVLGMFLAVPIIAVLKIVVNDYLDTIVDINKSESGEETNILGENNMTRVDCLKAKALLKLKMRKKEMEER